MPRTKQVCSQLRDQGRRLTPQRQAIIQALSRECNHPTADAVLQVVRERMPDISAATVYNTLNELVELGLLAEVLSIGGDHRYDPNLEQHDHIICVLCGHIEDVAANGTISHLPPQDSCGFEIIGHRLVFLGYCPTCRQNLQQSMKDKEN